MRLHGGGWCQIAFLIAIFSYAQSRRKPATTTHPPGDGEHCLYERFTPFQMFSMPKPVICPWDSVGCARYVYFENISTIFTDEKQKMWHALVTCATKDVADQCDGKIHNLTMELEIEGTTKKMEVFINCTKGFTRESRPKPFSDFNVEDFLGLEKAKEVLVSTDMPDSHVLFTMPYRKVKGLAGVYMSEYSLYTEHIVPRGEYRAWIANPPGVHDEEENKWWKWLLIGLSVLLLLIIIIFVVCWILDKKGVKNKAVVGFNKKIPFPFKKKKAGTSKSETPTPKSAPSFDGQKDVSDGHKFGDYVAPQAIKLGANDNGEKPGSDHPVDNASPLPMPEPSINPNVRETLPDPKAVVTPDPVTRPVPNENEKSLKKPKPVTTPKSDDVHSSKKSMKKAKNKTPAAVVTPKSDEGHSSKKSMKKAKNKTPAPVVTTKSDEGHSSKKSLKNPKKKPPQPVAAPKVDGGHSSEKSVKKPKNKPELPPVVNVPPQPVILPKTDGVPHQTMNNNFMENFRNSMPTGVKHVSLDAPHPAPAPAVAKPAAAPKPTPAAQNPNTYVPSEFVARETDPSVFVTPSAVKKVKGGQKKGTMSIRTKNKPAGAPKTPTSVKNPGTTSAKKNTK